MEPTHNNCIHCDVCDYQDVPCEPNICPSYEHNKFRYSRGYNFACFEVINTIKTLKETGAITQETVNKITESLPNILKGLR